MGLRLLLAGCLATALGASGAAAAEAPASSPCGAPLHHQFDFWVGRWSVYDRGDGRLIARDEVTKTYAGCVVEQRLVFFGDTYRHPGVSFPLAGLSVSRFDGERWVQAWVDNQWGAILMAGRPGPDSAMTLESVTPSRGRDVRLIWRRRPHGEVEIVQDVAKAGSGAWTRYGDLLYRPAPAQGASGSATP